MEDMCNEGDIELCKTSLEEHWENHIKAHIESREKTPVISLHAMVGTINPKTMRVMTQVNNSLLVAPIDSWSNHNFLNLNVVQKLNL